MEKMYIVINKNIEAFMKALNNEKIEFLSYTLQIMDILMKNLKLSMEGRRHFKMKNIYKSGFNFDMEELEEYFDKYEINKMALGL